MVPASLEDYMVGKKQDLSSLCCRRSNWVIQRAVSKCHRCYTYGKSKSRTLFEAASGAASMVGYHTDFSGEKQWR